MWIGSRRIVDENPEFAPEVDVETLKDNVANLKAHNGNDY